MKTTLKVSSFFVPVVLAVLPFVLWSIVWGLETRQFEKFSGGLTLATIAIYGILAYTLLTDFCEYECTTDKLIIRNFITKSVQEIDLQDITDLRLIDVHYRRGMHHNIKISHKDGTTTLKGININEMTQFFLKLKEKTGKG